MPRFVEKKKTCVDVINLNQLHINDVGFPMSNFIEKKKKKTRHSDKQTPTNILIRDVMYDGTKLNHFNLHRKNNIRYFYRREILARGGETTRKEMKTSLSQSQTTHDMTARRGSVQCPAKKGKNAPTCLAACATKIVESLFKEGKCLLSTRG